MDLTLFSPMLNPVTVERFAAWPDYMRREFALLAEERGLTDEQITAATGITEECLLRARRPTQLHALTYSEASGPSSEEDLAHRAVQKRYRDKQRATDA